MVKSETVMSILFSMKFLNISYADIFLVCPHIETTSVVRFYCTPSDLSYGHVHGTYHIFSLLVLSMVLYFSMVV
jgi:hypothetical protein